jgi:hypothetical protein
MFGKLTLEQRKTLQTILIQSGVIAFNMRTSFLSNAGLEQLLATLPMGEVDTIFAGALVRECERLGAPPSLGEYATVLLTVAVRNAISGNSDVVDTLTNIIAVYVPNHAVRYPRPTDQPSPPIASIPSLVPGVLTPPIKILVLAASPEEMEPLRLDREMVAIQNAIQSATRREAFMQPILIPAVQSTDLITLLKRHKPAIVHFAGHGAQEDGLIFLDAANRPSPLKPELLAHIFSLRDVKSFVQAVVLNACWSETQAAAIHSVNQAYVVGATQRISDRFAIAFTTGLYAGLGEGDTIPDAFQSGRTQAAVQLNDYEALSYTRILPHS